MPKGKKNCPNCNKELGVRTKVCDCGHEFAFKSKPKPKPLSVRQREREESGQPPLSIEDMLKQHIDIPSGRPPVSPKGYQGGSKAVWEASKTWEEPASDEVILDWVEKIKASYDKDGKILTNSAVKYFARYFWDIHSEEFVNVCNVIDSHVEEDVNKEDSAEENVQV